MLKLLIISLVMFGTSCLLERFVPFTGKVAFSVAQCGVTYMLLACLAMGYFVHRKITG